MTHFMKRMETPMGHLSFYFNRIHTAEGMRFHISVRLKGQPIAFNMHLVEGDWMLVNSENCPVWLSEVQTALSDTIKEYFET